MFGDDDVDGALGIFHGICEEIIKYGLVVLIQATLGDNQLHGSAVDIGFTNVFPSPVGPL